MVTKEQCLLSAIMDEVSYDRNPRLNEIVAQVFNYGKKYGSDMIFVNDEKGLDEGLRGHSPSFIVYSIIGEDSEYDVRDPFYTIDSGIHSLDTYDLQRNFPKELQKLVCWDVVQFLEESDCLDAFDTFVRQNYQNVYNNLDFDALDNYSTEEFFEADWDELAKSLMQSQPGQTMNEAVKLNKQDLKRMTKRIMNEIMSKGKK